MPTIDINAPPPNVPVNPPFDVQGPYSLVGVEGTAVNVKVVVSHPNNQDYTFGPQPPNGPAAYDTTCDNIPPSGGMLAAVTAYLLRADDGGELAHSPAVQVLIS